MELVMKLLISAVCLTLVAQPAQACHRYSRWYYPYPQKCGATRYAAITPEPVARPRPFIPEALPELPHEKTIPSAIIPDLPSTWEEIQRQDGIEQIRKIMDNKGDKK
jgi:hypothetical protein